MFNFCVGESELVSPKEPESVGPPLSDTKDETGSPIHEHNTQGDTPEHTVTPPVPPTPTPTAPQPRRLVLMLVGLKPHRKMWALSARPGESVIKYILFNGCPAIMLPTKLGSAPLIAWNTLTLKQLWDVELPKEDGTPSGSGKFEGIIKMFCSSIWICV